MANSDNFDHAVHTANKWVADVAAAFGSGDRRFAYRVLRAWLHTLRDRLTVESAAKFSAQLPELLRGVYYEGWEPHKVPIKYGPDEYIRRFAYEARIPVDEVRHAAATVAGALATHLSPGQLEEALAQLPEPVRTVIAGPLPAAPAAAPARGRTDTARELRERLEPISERISALEEQVSTVAEALRALAEGLEDSPLSGVSSSRGARAARLASEILMTAPPGPGAASAASR